MSLKCSHDEFYCFYIISWFDRLSSEQQPVPEETTHSDFTLFRHLEQVVGVLRVPGPHFVAALSFDLHWTLTRRFQPSTSVP